MVLIISVNTSLDRIIVVDDFQAGDVYRAKEEFMLAGGKALNVLRMVSMLGTNAGLLGFVGGYTGQKIKESLLAEGLSHRCQWVEIEKTSRICDVVVDTNKGCSTVLNSQGEPLEPIDIERLYGKLEEALREQNISHLVLTGSAPPGTPPNIYQHLVGIAKNFNVPTVVDASGSVLLETIKASPWLIKVNLQEFETIIGPLEEFFDIKTTGHFSSLASERVDAVCMVLIEKGVNIILTDGANGSRAWFSEGIWHMPSEPITAVNATGSGDAYLAGFLHGLIMTHNMKIGLDLATRAASSNAEHVLPTIDPQKVLRGTPYDLLDQNFS